MKRALFGSLVAIPVTLFFACAMEDPEPYQGTGGAPMGGAPTGGSAPGGTQAGGAAGSGVAGVAPVAGMAGSAPTGGMAGSAPTGGMAGSAPTGGMAGSAPTGGMAGSAPTGGMTGGGTAGNNATGGASGGSAGTTAGSAGALAGGTGGAPSTVPTIAELVGDLDGHLVYAKCGDTPSGDDCSPIGFYKGKSTQCTGGKFEHVAEYEIGGVEGKSYDVTMHFYGIMEPKQYGNSVTRESGTTAVDRNGGAKTGWGWQATPGQPLQNTDYNNYELHVLNQNNQVVGLYVFNADTAQGHWTLLINYSKTIPLIGGGKVRTRVFDQNCRQIKNCGPNGGSGAACASNARTITAVNQASPPPTGLQQPGLGAEPAHSGQWFYIDVTGVAASP